MAHVINNYKNAPPLIETQYEEILDEDKFVKGLVYYNKKNIIDEKLGNIIIKKHKKNDPSQQSFWSTDPSRLNYLVKSTNIETLDNEHDTKSKIIVNFKKTNEWTRDKGGIKITKMVIDPLLDDVKRLNEEQINMSNKKIQKGTCRSTF